METGILKIFFKKVYYFQLNFKMAIPSRNKVNLVVMTLRHSEIPQRFETKKMENIYLSGSVEIFQINWINMTNKFACQKS